MTPDLFIFNPLAEGFIARGKAFAPVKYQKKLATDLANLPQFLCGPEDIVLLPRRPSAAFLNELQHAGFHIPVFLEAGQEDISSAGSLLSGKIRRFCPWAWGPDSVALLARISEHLIGETAHGDRYFNTEVAQLYSKAWSAEFLRTVLVQVRAGKEPLEMAVKQRSSAEVASPVPWLCTEQEAGVVVNCLAEALAAIAAIRNRGQHRIVLKEAHGLAGHNAIRLWEPEVLPAHRRWMASALQDGRLLVVEPWLKRVSDFSVQLEMGPGGLQLCGYTGLLNDLKGQFLANWAETNNKESLPGDIDTLLALHTHGSGQVEQLYEGIFAMLEPELRRAGFIGPVNIDAFVYRTSTGTCRLKPVVEINPRYTFGRLTLELMKHVSPGACGLLRLVSRAQLRKEGWADFPSYAQNLSERFPVRVAGDSEKKICQGTLCLNDPGQAEVCLATFEVAASSHPYRLTSIGSLNDSSKDG